MGRTEAKFLVSENTLMWAFRYALGRRTGAVDDVIGTLKTHWSKLEPFTRTQIKEEIQRAIDMDMAGAECDIESWKGVMKLND